MQSKHWLGDETQAGRIIKKAGGPGRLSNLIQLHTDGKRDRTCIYRWNWPREVGGAGGRIPTSAMELVEKALRRDGIVLTDEDLFPRAYNDRIIR